MNINRVLRFLILALLFGSLAGQAGAGEISPAPPPTRAIPKAILPPVPPIFIGTELADSSLWLTPDGAIVGYDDLIPETYPNPEAKWIKIETMPFQPDPFKDLNDCPWKLRQAFSLEEAEDMLNAGWEYFATYKIGIIIMKKRVCK